MDPFEEQLRDLPWRKPSNELRDRLFAQQENDTVVRSRFRSWVPVASAAAVLVSAGLLAYHTDQTHEAAPAVVAVSVAENPAAASVLPADPEPIEIASSQSFFDFSAGANNAWSGPLTLQIEPN